MKAAIYIRVSTHQQVDKDSLPFQESSLVEYTRIILRITNYELFVDAGYSAKNTDRPAFQDMMSRVRNGEFTHILVWKIDRISRNLMDFLEMYDEMKKYQVAFVSHSEQFDTSNPMGEAMIKLIMVFAELERKQIGERIKAVAGHKISIGEVTSGAVPYGYSIKDKRLVINEDAPKVRTIHNKYIETGSVRSVMFFMFDEFGIDKSYRSIRNILTNKKYIGEHRGNKDYCPAIIDEKTFETVQNMISKNVKRNTFRTFIFSGLVKCNECGKHFGGTTRKVKYYRKSDDTNVVKEQKTHRCSTNKMNSRNCNNSKLYSESKIEQYLLQNIQDELHNHIINQKADQNEHKVKDNASKIKKIEEKIQRVKDSYVAGIIGIDEYKQDREELVSQISKLERQPKPNIIDLASVDAIMSDKFHLLYKSATEEDKRLIWRSIIDKIIVDNKGNIDIIFLS